MATTDCTRGRSLDERTAIAVLRRNGIATDAVSGSSDATPLPVAQDETAPSATHDFSKASIVAWAALDLLDLANKRAPAENRSANRLQAIADGFRAAAEALAPIEPKTITRQSIEISTVHIVLEVGGWTARPKACKLPADIIMDIARLGILAGIRLAGGELIQAAEPREEVAALEVEP